MMGYPDGWSLPDGPSLLEEPPQTWHDWPDCAWTESDSEEHRRPRLMGLGNGVVDVVGEAWGRDLLGSAK
jgi:hypothetical protein